MPRLENDEVSAVLDEMGDLLEIQGANGFRVRAYRRAAQALENLGEPVATLIEQKRLSDVPGIGGGTIKRIEEILETGSFADLQAIRQELPGGLLELLKVSGLGPKKVRLFYTELGVTSIDDLEAAARSGALSSLPRMGKKSEANILKAVEGYRRRGGRVPLGDALPQGRAIVAALADAPGVEQIQLAGSTRRGRETIGDLDVLVAAADAGPVMDLFSTLPAVREVMLRGDTKCSVRLHSELQVDLRVLARESFGAALHYFTGSQMHNIAVRDRGKRQGLRINEYGVYTEPAGERICGATEEEVFAAVGLDYIPPEIREDRGEIDAAEKGTLPTLIERADLLGDLHTHTSLGMGEHSVEAMARAAVARGHAFLAITDRSASVERMRDRVRAVREATERIGDIALLAGAEVTIGPEGELSVDADALRDLDWVVAAIDSHLVMSEEDMTGRIVRALESGVVDCLAHPTGRVVGAGQRDGYPLDLEQVLTRAASLGVSLELSSQPTRLDLDALHCRHAKELGATIAINTDAKTSVDLDLLEYGVLTARRGWLEKGDVVNAAPAATIAERRRDRAR